MDVITSHQGPDFDAIASMVAAKKLYPEALLVRIGEPDSAVKEFLTLHRGAIPIEPINDLDLDKVRRIIVVDTRTPARLGPLRLLLHRQDVEVHVYDHHPPTSEGVQGDIDVMEPLGAAVTVILKRIWEALPEVVIEPAEATLFLTAIYEETGCLTYDSTSPDDLRAAARLLELGASLPMAAHFQRRPLDLVQLQLLDRLAHAGRRLTIGGHRVLLASASCDQFVEDLAVLASRLQSLEDLDAIILAVTMGERTFVVGRSREASVDIGFVLSELGGGGHACAASASLPAQDPEPLLDLIAHKLRNRWSPEPTAAQLMTEQVATLAGDGELSAAQALERLRELGHTATIVTLASKPVGMLARSDLDKALRHNLGHAAALRFMTSPIISVPPDAPRSQVQRVLVEHDIGRLPVMEGEELRGIISRTDILRSLYEPQPQPHATALPSLASELLRLPQRWFDVLRDIGEQAEAHGVEAYAVGGFVRDLLLLRRNQTPDLDIVIEGDGLAFARHLAQLWKAHLVQHENFQTSTLTLSDGLSLDVATARKESYCRPAALPAVEGSTLKQDLYRRDFTLNAMALRLTREHFGQLIDYFGGQTDLRNGLIRVLHNHSFIDDPTRMLRAVRFEQRLRFHIGPNTERLLRQALAEGVFEQTTGQRLRDELLHILRDEAPYESIIRLHKLKILKSIHPLLVPDVKTQTHLSSCVDAIARMASLGWPCDPALVYLRVWLLRLSDEDLNTLNLHLGLPQWIRPNYNKLLWSLSNPARPASFIYELLKPLASEDIAILFVLAQHGKVHREPVDNALVLYTRELRHSKPLLNGRDAIAAGWSAGPELGELLGRAFHAQLDEKWQSRQTALDWLACNQGSRG